jgi:hypothetical protein
MVCSCQSHRDPDGSKRLMIFVQRRLAASRESFGKGVAVLFTSVINKLTWDEARVIIVAGRRQASTPKSPSSSGVNNEAHKFQKQSQYFLLFPSDLQPQPSSYINLQHPPPSQQLVVPGHSVAIHHFHLP